MDYKLFNFSRRINCFIVILRQYHFFLPKSPRTLLGTITNYEIKNITNGKYFHFGIKSVVRSVLSKLHGFPNVLSLSTLYLKLNIDGLPLFNKSDIQFWPILGLIERFSAKPFLIGLFYGKSKPSSVNEYLQEFIEEMLEILQKGGLLFNGINYKIKIC